MWLVAQRWEDLLFAHWPVEPEAVRRSLPPGVEPDLRGGSAWVGVVAFVMVGTRGHHRLPALGPIPELNVRTYVRVGGIPAVWFLSLDASSSFFVCVGRALYGLPYWLADMATARDGDRVSYRSERGRAAFSAVYRPSGPPTPAAPGSLEHFLVERYRLFAQRRGQLVTAEVSHEPWPLQRAEARIDVSRMAPPGLSLGGEPLVHYSRCVTARIAAPVRVRRPAPAAAVGRPALPY